MREDTIRWSPRALLSKYDAGQVDYVSRRIAVAEPDGNQLSDFCIPHESIEVQGNLLTTAGVTRVAALLIGASTGTLDSTRVRLGVGDATAAAVVGDTSLGTNQYYRVIDATYPQAASGALTFQATYTGANFAWQCWGLDVGTATVTSSSTPATLVSRKVSSFGTKSSGTWVLTVTITFS